jgi:hypothetical protein
MLAMIVVSHPGTSFSGFCVHPAGLFRATVDAIVARRR